MYLVVCIYFVYISDKYILTSNLLLIYRGINHTQVGKPLSEEDVLWQEKVPCSKTVNC